jgi:hypothetical protein
MQIRCVNYERWTGIVDIVYMKLREGVVTRHQAGWQQSRVDSWLRQEMFLFSDTSRLPQKPQTSCSNEGAFSFTVNNVIKAQS